MNLLSRINFSLDIRYIIFILWKSIPKKVEWRYFAVARQYIIRYFFNSFVFELVYDRFSE
jgi:hypothetical protein